MRVAQSASVSDPGRVRRRNEDSLVCQPPLFAVADGMGGAQAGEIASRIAVTTFRELASSPELDAEARLRSIIQEANRRIYARAARDPDVSGMGTTVTAALLDGDRVSVGHVGDSRAYRLRDGALEQLTEDHSLVADLVRSGRLSPEEAELHPQRSVITRALGTDPAVVVDSFSVEAQAGDVFLLCSDGLTIMVDQAELVRTLTSTSSLDEAARLLVEAANRQGGEDNITVVVFSLEDGEPEVPPDEDTLTGLEVPTVIRAVAPAVGQDTVALASATVVRPAITNGHVEGPRPAPVAAPLPARPRPARRAALIAALVLALFAGLAALALWGLSRAHFVGANGEGRIVVYQGVPWNLFGDSVKLYREVYVSGLLAVQLTPHERSELFDHSLVSESDARAEIARYEQEATPSTPSG